MKVRVVVDRAHQPRCGLKVGDWFEVTGSQLHIPEGTSFCLYALNATLPVMMSRLADSPNEDWLRRKPWICCPDPDDGVQLRLDLIR